MKSIRKTKIVITLGPSTDNIETLKQLFAKANIARFNFSHGSHEEHKKRLDLIRKVEEELDKPITTLADLKGPEIRTTNKQPLEFKKSETATLWDDIPLNIPYIELDNYLLKDDIIYMADGTIAASYMGNNKIMFLHDVKITPKRKVSFPYKNIPLPAVSEQDKKDIEFIKKEGFDLIAQSFVKKAEDVEEVYRLSQLPIIVKIEHIEGFKNLDIILDLDYVEGVMVARGDLGVEVPLKRLPIIQKETIRKTKERGKCVIIATHMLKSMVDNPLPTRAEVNDVAHAVFDGADCVMLSEESSVGKFNVKAVEIMDDILREVEFYVEQNPYLSWYSEWVSNKEPKDYKSIVSYNAVSLEKKLLLPLIAPTIHGTTPKKLSMLRPTNPIYSPTPNKKTYKILNLYYGVYPKLKTYEPLFEKFEEIKKEFNVNKGVFVFGYPPGNKRTNTIIIV